MEQTQKENSKDVIREIAKHPASAESYIYTIHTALEMAHEVFYDLLWEKGGKIDPIHEEYVISLNNIIREILRRTNV